jgi:membrane-associated phospholipid phosphatase
MTIARTVLLAAALAAAAAPAHADSRKTWSTVSDVGAGALAATALGLPVALGDKQGLFQAAGSLALGAGTAELLSLGIKEQRPDGSGNDSFPSSHAALAGAAAATIQARYGWGVGIPAQIVAAVVATGRVESRKHNWYDAVAGGLIGEISGFVITRKYGENTRIIPFADSHGGGFFLARRF